MTHLMKTRDVAAYLALSQRSVKQLKADGILPFVRFGRSVRFRPIDVEALVAARVTSIGA